MTAQNPAPERARVHVKHVRDFFYHLMTFVFANALLIVVDRRGGVSDGSILGLDWAYWVVPFWGFGVLGHAVYAFFDDYRAERLSTRISR